MFATKAVICKFCAHRFSFFCTKKGKDIALYYFCEDDFERVEEEEE